MNSQETQNLEMEEERQQKRWKKISQIGGKLGENDSIDAKERMFRGRRSSVSALLRGQVQGEQKSAIESGKMEMLESFAKSNFQLRIRVTSGQR